MPTTRRLAFCLSIYTDYALNLSMPYPINPNRTRPTPRPANPNGAQPTARATAPHHGPAAQPTVNPPAATQAAPPPRRWTQQLRSNLGLWRPAVREWIMDNGGYYAQPRRQAETRMKDFSARQGLLKLGDASYLNLNGLRLSSLPRLFPPGVERLSLYGCELRSIESHLPAGLRDLDLAINELRTLPGYLPRSLYSIRVSQNQLSALSGNLPNRLGQLIADNNRLTTIPESLPRHLHTLTVGHNELSALPTNLPPNLRTLAFNNNQITALPNNLPLTLTKLNASNNRLRDISPEVISRLAQMNRSAEIDLTGNPLSPQTLARLDRLLSAHDYRGPTILCSRQEAPQVGPLPVPHAPAPNRPPAPQPAAAPVQPAVSNTGAEPQELAGIENELVRDILSSLNPEDRAIFLASMSLRMQMRQQRLKVEGKATPRPSSNGYSDLNFNGMVPVPSSEGGELVVCRHFAQMFVEHPRKKTGLMAQFSTQEGIQTAFGDQWDEVDFAFSRAIREAPQGCKHVVAPDELGRYLTALATTLQAIPQESDGPQEANVLLICGNHAMALHVQRKNKSSVDYFTAKLYDPNTTANYKRVEQLTAQGLRSLKLEDMLFGPHHYGGSMGMVSLDHHLQPQMDRGATLPHAKNMFMALRCGVYEDVEAMLQSSTRIPTDRFKLLQAESAESERYGLPGLYVALCDGHAETVKRFAETVLSSNDLGREKIVELLAPKSRDGTSGLFMALQNGNTETIKAFAQTVSASHNLGPEEIVELLAAKSSDGTPGLFMAFQDGDTETITAFAQTVSSSHNLGPEEMVELLAAKRSDGVGADRKLTHLER